MSGTPLSARQRAHLKSLAHSLKPVQHVGKDGVTDALARSVEDVLQSRELFKVKVLESAPAPAQAIGAELESRIPGLQLVQVIGRTVVLYRPDPEEPQIRLPG